MYSFKEILLVLGSKGKLGLSYIFAQALLDLFGSSWSSSGSPSNISLILHNHVIMMEFNLSRLHHLAGSLMIFHRTCRIPKAPSTSFWYASWCKVNHLWASSTRFAIAWTSVAHFGLDVICQVIPHFMVYKSDQQQSHLIEVVLQLPHTSWPQPLLSYMLCCAMLHLFHRTPHLLVSSAPIYLPILNWMRTPQLECEEDSKLEFIANLNWKRYWRGQRWRCVNYTLISSLFMDIRSWR